MHTIAAVAACDKDRFADLTDDLLQHVLSFLPPDEALQTCVLDTRWRDLWRRTTSLVLIFDDERSRTPFSENIEKLAKLIIQLRGNLPLVKCVIHSCPDEALEWTYSEGAVIIDAPEWTYTNTRLLVEYAIKCQANELIVRAGDTDIDYKPLYFRAPFMSRHLKSLDLGWVNLEFSALDFSGCPVLQDLKMIHCCIHAKKISSESLKSLCITGSCMLPDNFHIRICAPVLTSLQLNDFNGLTPLLDHMPFLVKAHVRLGYSCLDFCSRHLQGCDSPDFDCHAHLVKGGVLLNGLSNAVDLELIDRAEKIIYRWDLKWCPMFDKLNTLLLNDWFTANDLVCILKHTPNLGRLTLQLNNTKKLARATGAQETIEQSFVCPHLKVVSIECRKVDEGIFKILKILSACGILREKISIKDPCSRSDLGGFHFTKNLEPMGDRCNVLYLSSMGDCLCLMFHCFLVSVSRSLRIPWTVAPVAAAPTIDDS